MVNRLTLGIAKPWILTQSATTPDNPIENKSNPAIVNAIGRFIIVPSVLFRTLAFVCAAAIHG